MSELHEQQVIELLSRIAQALENGARALKRLADAAEREAFPQAPQAEET